MQRRVAETQRIENVPNANNNCPRSLECRRKSAGQGRPAPALHEPLFYKSYQNLCVSVPLRCVLINPIRISASRRLCTACELSRPASVYLAALVLAGLDMVQDGFTV